MTAWSRRPLGVLHIDGRELVIAMQKVVNGGDARFDILIDGGPFCFVSDDGPSFDVPEGSTLSLEGVIVTVKLKS